MTWPHVRPPIRGCWQRLARATQHRKDAIEVWNDHLAPHPYDYTVIDNHDGTYVVRLTRATPVPAELGILIGACLYNLVPRRLSATLCHGLLDTRSAPLGPHRRGRY